MRTGVLIVAAWWTAHVVLIALSIAEVAFYSLVIAPGLPEAAYHAHAERTAPWVSIVCGGPVFYGLGRGLVAATGARFAPWAVWGLYTAVDLAAVVAFGAFAPAVLATWVLSQSIKAAATALALRSAPG